MKHLLPLISLVTLPLLTQAQSFSTVTSYSVGNQPVAVAAGDFDRDGYTDAVLTRYYNNTVAVLLNKKDGKFALSASYSVSARPTGSLAGNASVEVADVNGDGYTDIITLNYNDRTASVLLNKKDGTFAPFVTYATSPYPIALAVADVNSDGFPDIVVTHSYDTTGNSIGVLLNKKDGTFASTATYPTGGNSSLSGVAVGDVNGDGYVDIATGYYDTNQVGVLLNQKNGTFASPILYAVGGVVRPSRIRMSDVNKDGFADIVTIGTTENVAVLVNKKDGTFNAALTYLVSARSQLTALTVSDVSGDGYPDILTGIDGTFNSPVGVMLNQKNGTFAAPINFNGSSSVSGIAIADVNKDGRADILVADLSNASLDVRLNTATFLATTASLSQPHAALFPNPTSQLTTLTGARAGARIQVLDALGRLITTTTADASGSVALTLPTGLAGGVYIVRTGSQALRLLVN